MKIGIIGTGAYALALSMMFYENTKDITLWTNSNEEKEKLEKTRYSEVLDLKIPKTHKFTTSMEELALDKDIIVIAVMSKYVNDVTLQLKKYYKKNQHLCIASKGIEQNSCLFLNQVVEKHIKTKHLAIISGATFAIDMIKKVPLGLSLATTSKLTQNYLKEALENDYLKLKITKDILGTEICGATKNIIAIASGIFEGLNYPDSTKCMFITESLHDIKNLIKFLGGNKKTILSYAGVADLLLTCTSDTSRNYTLGKMIGSNEKKEIIDNYIKNTTIEGLYTLKSIYQLTKKKKIDIPLINLIYDIVIKEKNPNLLINYLKNKEVS